ncbi:MAG: hypothetical protein NTNFB01_05290 [Nitrospira sp.]
MIVFAVYGSTQAQAEEVAVQLQAGLRTISAFVTPRPATTENMERFKFSACPAIVKNGVLLWQGSYPTGEQIQQWGADTSKQCDQVERATGQFGYEETNPIPADGNWYCRRLRCSRGHPFWYHRLGSSGSSPDGHITDRMSLLCFGGEAKVMLYFDMYHKGHSSLVPEELTFDQEPLGQGTTAGIIANFPIDLQNGRSET